jgi:hypothetical protein
LTGLTAILAGLHLQMARITDCPALAMSEGEARQFLQAWQNYLRHLSIAASQKTIDLITACSVTIFLYVPRVVALRERRHAPPPRQQEGPLAPVFHFVPATGPVRGMEPGQPPAPPADPETLDDGPVH